MKKIHRYIILSALSIIGLLGLTVLLSVTVFKDKLKDKLIEFVIEQEQEKLQLIQSYSAHWSAKRRRETQAAALRISLPDMVSGFGSRLVNLTFHLMVSQWKVQV